MAPRKKPSKPTRAVVNKYNRPNSRSEMGRYDKPKKNKFEKELNAMSAQKRKTALASGSSNTSALRSKIKTDQRTRRDMADVSIRQIELQKRAAKMKKPAKPKRKPNI